MNPLVDGITNNRVGTDGSAPDEKQHLTNQKLKKTASLKLEQVTRQPHPTPERRAPPQYPGEHAPMQASGRH